MKLPLKIVLINIGLSIIWAFLSDGGSSHFAGSLGVAFLLGGGFTLIIGLLALFATDKRYAQGFLLSGGILFLLGLITCSNM